MNIRIETEYDDVLFAWNAYAYAADSASYDEPLTLAWGYETEDGALEALEDYLRGMTASRIKSSAGIEYTYSRNGV